MSLKDKIYSATHGKSDSDIKQIGETAFFDTYYPEGYHSAKITPKCPNGTLPPKTSCPCSDMKQNIHQATNITDTSQWIRGKDHAIHMEQWMIVFPAKNVKRLGSCVYKELLKIADYGAAFFAGEYQILYTIHYIAGFVYIRLAMNTVSLKTGKEYTESMAGHLQEYFDYLSDFVQREYGLLIIPDIYGCVVSE